MKTTLFVLCLLCASIAYGQSTPSMSALEFPSHGERATAVPMASGNDLLGGYGVVIAHGEMPLADVPLPPKHETPLGDIARQARKEHLTARKAEKIWESSIYGIKAVQVKR